MRRTLPDVQRDKLVDYLTHELRTHAQREHLIMSLGLCGLRSIEVRRLNAAHYNRGTLYVPTAKKGRPRTLSLPKTIAVPLALHAGHITRVFGYQFTDILPMFPTRSAKRLDHKQIDRICRETTGRVCGAVYSFHKLRHTFAWREYRRARDVFMVSRLLGHRSVANTQIYLDAMQTERYPLAWELSEDEALHTSESAGERQPELSVFPPADDVFTELEIKYVQPTMGTDRSRSETSNPIVDAGNAIGEQEPSDANEPTRKYDAYGGSVSMLVWNAARDRERAKDLPGQRHLFD